jgi:hypothetical protein
MKRGAFIPVMIVLLVVVGCSSGPAKGMIRGSLVAVGGPSPSDTETPLPGSVTVTNSGGQATTVTVGDDGQFEVHVAVGSYTLSGSSPLFGGGTEMCSGGVQIQVQTSSPVTANVACTMR